MTDYVLKANPGHLTMTGAAFMAYANRYYEAAMGWLSSSQQVIGFDPVPYYLLCQSLELHLKSFIWLQDRVDAETIKNRYRHNLKKLWNHSKARRIERFARTTKLRDSVISLIGPYYQTRKFNYLDLNMIFNGYRDLQSEPRVLPTLKRLTNQLRKSLRQPILRAS